MRITRISLWLLIVTFLIIGTLLNAFAQRQLNIQSEPGALMVRVEKIAVMPFIKGRYGSTMNERLNSTLSRFYFNPENIAFDSDEILMGYIHKALKERHGEKVVPLADSKRAWEKISVVRSEDTPRTLSKRFGEALKTNLVMAGNVWKYRERVGGSYGIESPASVAFDLYLIDVSGGKMLWNASFQETQRSLSENILDAKAFFERKGRWLLAGELARYGVSEIFKKYPY